METKEVTKKLEILESEFKLIKGELKQTLISVRDYLVNIKLTPPAEATGGDPPDMDMTKIIMAGDMAIGRGTDAPRSPAGGNADGKDNDISPLLPEGEMDPEARRSEAGREEPPAPEAGFPGPSPEYERAGAEASRQSTPAVNLMANLIRWVAKAKRELGNEQLSTFLEVYGISGHLSPELKDAIQYLAEVTSEQSADASAVDVWSQLLLELHGILTGGDAPLHPLRPFWNDVDEAKLSEIEAEEGKAGGDKAEDKPLKLKLVLSNGDSMDREFTIDLNPENGKV